MAIFILSMDAEPLAKMLEFIKKGNQVRIERKRTRKVLEGTIIEIIDKIPYNENGIEVRITGNYIGNVKKILTKENKMTLEELLKKIDGHEQKFFELKSSFKYDVKISKHVGTPTANESLRRKIAEEAASFMNVDGGIICIGVDNHKNILGLEGDFSLQEGFEKKEKFDLIDKLRGEIKQALLDYLTTQTWLPTYEINPYVIQGKDVLCLKLQKSPEPVFIKMTHSAKIDKKDQLVTWWNCWVRADNGIFPINFDAFMKTWKRS
jgi:uncharacterized protein YwbE